MKAEYIEREALIERLRKRLKNSVILGWLCSIIAEIPTADVAPVVHGRWVDDPDDPRFFCRECGRWLLIEYATADMNYCPNCGAKMDKVDEGGCE